MSIGSNIESAKALYAVGSKGWEPETLLIVNGVALPWRLLSGSAYFSSLLASGTWNDLSRVLERIDDEDHLIARVRIGYEGTHAEAIMLHRVLCVLETSSATKAEEHNSPMANDHDVDNDDDDEHDQDGTAASLDAWSCEDLCNALRCADMYNL